MAASTASAVQIYWASHPITSNQTLMLLGAGFTGGPPQDLGSDTAPMSAGASQLSVTACRTLAPTQCHALPVLQGQVWSSGAKAVLSDATTGAPLPADVFNINVTVGGASWSTTVNDARVWWWTSEPMVQRGVAPTGALITLMGAGLGWTSTGECPPFVHPDGHARTSAASGVRASPRGVDVAPVITLMGRSGAPITVTASRSSCYKVEFTLPEDMDTGAYDVYMTNALTPNPPGQAVLSGLEFMVVALQPWPSTVFPVGGACGNVSTCLAAAAAAGGGIVQLPAGVTNMPDRATLSLGADVTLQGNAAGSTLAWLQNTATPGAPLVSGPGPWRLQNLSILVQTVLDNQPVVQIAGADRCIVQGVNVLVNLTDYPDSRVTNPIQVQSGTNWVVQDSSFAMYGNCSASWPRNCNFWVASSNNGVMRGNTFTAGCQGYSVSSSSQIMMVNNTLRSVGNDSEGSGFNSFYDPQVLENVYFGENHQVGNVDAYLRWESMTYDGSGSSFFGWITDYFVNDTGAYVVVPGPPAPAANYTGIALVVLGGYGLGQVGRISYAVGNTWALARPLPSGLLPNDSVVSIIGYRGRALYEGNYFENGTVFQYFGTAIDTYAAGNTFVNLNITRPGNPVSPAGLLAWGLDYNGKEPCMQSQFLDNSFLCGTQFTTRSSGSGDPAFNWTGLYNLGHVYRNNLLLGSTDWSITGLSSDVIVENTTLLAAPCHPGWPPAGPGNGSVQAPAAFVWVGP